MPLISRALLSSIAVAALLLIVAARAHANTRELLVRLDAHATERATSATAAADPQVTAMLLGVDESAIAPASITSAPAPWLRLQFADAQSATRAADDLARNPLVARVSKNLMYQPAMRYTFRPARRSDARMSGPSLESTPLPIRPPAVLPTPIRVRPGTDPVAADDWALEAVRMPTPGNLQTTVPVTPITVAVIDSGVDYDHEDLQGAMWRKPGSVEVGYDTAHGHARPFDIVHFDPAGCSRDEDCSSGFDQSKFLINPGHGTHCAGHIGAVASNSKGIRGIGSGSGNGAIGSPPSSARIMALKFFSDFGEPNAGHGDDAAAVRAIDYAIENHARIISASWGGLHDRDEADQSEIKAAIRRARAAGVLFVVAAGNWGTDQDHDEQPAFPAAYRDLDNLLVVAAVDRQDRLAETSGWGAKTVHIAAPGVKVLSTTVGNRYSDVVAIFKDAQGKEEEIDWDGTSMATPIVSGAAALVWSRHPAETYLQIKARLLGSVRKISGLAGKVSSGGILDVSAALKLP